MDAKYLGVTLSNDLEWSKHIAIMTNKANSKLSFLRRNLKGCPEKLNSQRSQHIYCYSCRGRLKITNRHVTFKPVVI